MTPKEANALMTLARQHDNFVVDTDEAMKTWAKALGPQRRSDGTTDPGIPYQAGELIVRDYYGKHPDPQNRKPVDASVVRKLYYSKLRETTAHQRALGPPEPDRRGGPPPHIKNRLAAFKAKHGKKTEGA